MPPPTKAQRAINDRLLKDGLKICTVCLCTLPLSSFYVDRYHNSYSPKCKDCVKNYHSEYYKENRENIVAIESARSKERYAKDSTRKKQTNKEWRLRNNDKFNNYTTERRLKLKGNFIEHVEFAEVIAVDGHCCGICGEYVCWDEQSMDHIKPIALGGTHDYSNVQLAHLSCNKSKGARYAGRGVI